MSEILNRKTDQNARDRYQMVLSEPVRSISEIDRRQIEQFSEALSQLGRGESIEERMSKHYQRVLDSPVAAADSFNSFKLDPMM